MQELILGYENDLLSPEFCSKRENLELRISSGFVEYGKSGRIYNREDTILSLLRAKDRDIYIKDFEIEILSDEFLLAHYISIHNKSGEEALRTSIWKKEKSEWKIYFHQGTLRGGDI